jgi:exonuclease III
MRLVSWNLAHQCREDPIPQSLLEAVVCLAPDVLSLNEYVHGPSRAHLIERLKEIGLLHWHVSKRLNGHNQVLVASRHPLEAGELTGPATEGLGGESNFMHVRLPDNGLEIVGLRAPAYTGAALTKYWQELVRIVNTCEGRRIVFMGDLNTDPDQLRRPTAKYLVDLRSKGWIVPAPEGDWSFVSKSGSGTRIDHAIVSSELHVTAARYVVEIGQLKLAAQNKTGAISDHAPLIIELSASAA